MSPCYYTQYIITIYINNNQSITCCLGGYHGADVGCSNVPDIHDGEIQPRYGWHRPLQQPLHHLHKNRERERNVLFNDALNTFHLRLYGVRHMVKDHSDSEREREMFYLTTHSTHFIYGYMASDIWLRTILILRERNVLFNDALNTFYLRLYGVRHMVKDHSDREREKCLINNALNTFYLRLYGVRHMVKDHSDSEKERKKCFI